MVKVVRIFLDDSTNIVDAASQMLDSINFRGFQNGKRIDGEMKRALESEYQSGYLVMLTETDSGIIATSNDFPEVGVLGIDEEEAVRLAIERIEEILNAPTSIVRVEDK